MSGLSGDSAPVGGSGFSDMLALMADPKALQAKYAEFAKRQKAAEDAVALVGPANQIAKLRADAAKDKETAKAMLADAERSAKQTRDNAQAAADNLLAKANADAQAIVAEARKATAEVAKAQKAASDEAIAANKRGREIDAKAKDLDQQRMDVEGKAKALAIAQAAHADNVKRFKYVREQLMGQLAEHSKYLNVS